MVAQWGGRAFFYALSSRNYLTRKRPDILPTVMSTYYIAHITVGSIGSTGASEFVLGGRASGKYVPLKNQHWTVGRVEQAKKVTYS